MIKDIIIIGTGGNCIDIVDAIIDINKSCAKYNILGFLDDNPNVQDNVIFGIPVLGTLKDACNFPDSLFVNGIGSEFNYYKKSVIIAKTGIGIERFETIIHPSASISNFSHIGSGTVILQNVTIASNVSVGNHVIILPNTVLSHDDKVGDYCCIAGGACVSGGCSIGDSVYIGTNAAVRGNLTIGSESLVGMGAVVTKDVPPRVVVAGCPAKKIRMVYF
ncbi:NeuD/PglB/VioB family sugar acetyltransferase [Salidesulfovibrio brasiliensis]|uniref:NeuD/PglB/VioB family sugar acetyltransferase n=1 Tax=Salidesulfovibrio brasiliensis TaxID=221711 RepID=UPI0009FB7091|nr:NeuD/PglB/VioB family sugar acetyltransferase [Salidesulfovibrio brasiliensis]